MGRLPAYQVGSIIAEYVAAFSQLSGWLEI